MLHQLSDTLASYNMRQYAIADLSKLPTAYMGSAMVTLHAAYRGVGD
jgi:hypothetical protein